MKPKMMMNVMNLFLQVNSKVVKVKKNEYEGEYGINLKVNVVLENDKSLKYNGAYNFIYLSK